MVVSLACRRDSNDSNVCEWKSIAFGLVSATDNSSGRVQLTARSGFHFSAIQLLHSTVLNRSGKGGCRTFIFFFGLQQPKRDVSNVILCFLLPSDKHHVELAIKRRSKLTVVSRWCSNSLDRHTFKDRVNSQNMGLFIRCPRCLLGKLKTQSLSVYTVVITNLLRICKADLQIYNL